MARTGELTGRRGRRRTVLMCAAVASLLVHVAVLRTGRLGDASVGSISHAVPVRWLLTAPGEAAPVALPAPFPPQDSGASANASADASGVSDAARAPAAGEPDARDRSGGPASSKASQRPAAEPPTAVAAGSPPAEAAPLPAEPAPPPAFPTVSVPPDAIVDGYVARRALTSPPVPTRDVRIAWPAGWYPTGRLVGVYSVFIDEAGIVQRMVIDGPTLPGPLQAAAERSFGEVRFEPGRIGVVAVKSLIRIEVVFDHTTPVAGGTPDVVSRRPL